MAVNDIYIDSIQAKLKILEKIWLNCLTNLMMCLLVLPLQKSF